MKKLIFILFVILTINSYSQRTVDANTVIARTDLIVEGDTIDFTSFVTQDSELYKLLFNNDTVAPAHQEGILFYDSLSHSMSYYNEASDVTINIGQEQVVRVYNNDVVGGISDGQVCYVDSASVLPFPQLAKSDLFNTTQNVLGVATHDIAFRDTGYITTFGIVRGINTSSWSAGDRLYVSSTTAGSLTNVKPEYPNYTIVVAQVLTSDVSGMILVNNIGQAEDVIFNAFVGNFLEGFDFLITSDGSNIIGSLTRTDGGDYLTMNFSSGFDLLDVSATSIEDTIVLTAGTMTNPQFQYVYILESTRKLTVSTVSFPDAQHIPVAKVVCQTAAEVQLNGALRNQNINNHLASTTGQGHITEMGDRMRIMPSSWFSGTEGTATIVSATSPDSVTIAVTGGKVYQMHKQIFAAKNMALGDSIIIINDFTEPYKHSVNLGSEIIDALGNTMSGKSFSFVVWGVANKTGEYSPVFLNLPIGSYSSSANAILDPSGYSVYTIPSIYNGVGFLIARFTFTHSVAGGGTWTLAATEDLRGRLPNTSAGGGVGGSGVSTFLGLLDSPSSYVGFGDSAVYVNSTADGLEFREASAGLWQVGATATELITPDDVYVDGGLLMAGDLDLDANQILNVKGLGVNTALPTALFQVNGDGIYSSLGQFINNANDTILSIDDDSRLWGDHIETNLGGSVYLGVGTGRDDGTANDNVGLGNACLASITTGRFNTFAGTDAGNILTTGQSNTAVGNGAMESSNGSGNTAYGTGAGQSITGNSNTVLGSSAGKNLGSSSVAVGVSAARNNTGSGRLFIETNVSIIDGEEEMSLISGDFNTGSRYIKIGGVQSYHVDTIADNDATPTMAGNLNTSVGSTHWVYNGTANSVTVTDLDNPIVGAEYRIRGNSDTYTITIQDSGNFNLSADWVGGADDVITIFVVADNNYIEVSRSNN